jgi:ribosomal protein L9
MRFAFQFGRGSALRATSETIDQLQAQLAQLRYNLAVKEEELALMLRELAEARLELARRDTIDALARAPSPSTMMH